MNKEAFESAANVWCRRHTGDIVEKRVERAEALISMGEISARHALEGSLVAPDNEDTLHVLDEDRRPPVPCNPMPEEILRTVPARRFELDRTITIFFIV